MHNNLNNIFAQLSEQEQILIQLFREIMHLGATQSEIIDRLETLENLFPELSD
jgi:hypothetical protein